MNIISTEARAELSLGSSDEPIHRMVERLLRARHRGGGTFIDVGCGKGAFWPRVRELFERGTGVDIIRHPELPEDMTFAKVNLDVDGLPVADGAGDVVVAIETIEHLENPRAFVRDLKRITKPGGWMIVTTPNQLSFISKLTLVVKNQFNAFQSRDYPAHITALLASDLQRIAAECGLTNVAIDYTGSGRMPGTPWHWPRFFGGRRFSDNVALVAQRPPQLSQQA